MCQSAPSDHTTGPTTASAPHRMPPASNSGRGTSLRTPQIEAKSAIKSRWTTTGVERGPRPLFSLGCQDSLRRRRRRGPTTVYRNPPGVDQPDPDAAVELPGAAQRPGAAAPQGRGDGVVLDRGPGVQRRARAIAGRSAACLPEEHRDDAGAVGLLRPVHEVAGGVLSVRGGGAFGADAGERGEVQRVVAVVPGRRGDRLDAGEAARSSGGALPGLPDEPYPCGGQAARGDEREGPGAAEREADLGPAARRSCVPGGALGAGPAPDVRPGVLPVSAVRLHRPEWWLLHLAAEGERQPGDHRHPETVARPQCAAGG